MKFPLKSIDVIIIILAVGLVFLSAYSAYIKPQAFVQIYIKGRDNEWVFNKDAEESVNVSGPLGVTAVRIGGGCAWVESSPCQNQNCVAVGFVRKAGQWAACLPNQVLVMVKENSGEDYEVDAITQ